MEAYWRTQSAFESRAIEGGGGPYFDKQTTDPSKQHRLYLFAKDLPIIM